MSKNKSPDLPETPRFQESPQFTQGLGRLQTLGQRLTDFDLTGSLAPLSDTISVNPETTRMFLSGLMAELEPQFRDIRQRTISDLAANNQLESSVAVDRLARGDEDLQRAILGQTTAFGLADTSRALENRLRLFGTGLDTTQSATSFAQQDQALRNQFNLANYENQVARVLQQTEDKGGLFGGLTGGIGGALAGAALAPLTGGSSLLLGLGGGLLGGAAGAMGPSGTGTSLLQSGAGVFGSSLGSPTSSLSPSRALPGSTASSDPFGLLNKRSVSRFDNMALGL